jgi:AraC family transcriptional regulator
MQLRKTGNVQIFRISFRISAREDKAMPDPLNDRRLGSIDATRRSGIYRPVVSGVEVIREGQVEPFLQARPALTSAAIQWGGLALEDYRVPACVIARHEHVQNFLHVVLSGSVRYEVLTGGKSLRFTAGPGTTFVLPRGTVDELRWAGPTHRIAVAIHPSLLVNVLDETVRENDVELIEHWNVADRHIMAVLMAMTADLDEGSPAGRLYGESLATALAVYLLNRYAVRRYVPTMYKGGLPGYRLKRVLDYIGDSLTEDLSLVQLAALAGMSPHYFAELFKRSVGYSPHRFVLLQRLERAKQALRDPTRSVLEAGVSAGFQNPSHFARVFHRFVGVSPSRFQSDQAYRLRSCENGDPSSRR